MKAYAIDKDFLPKGRGKGTMKPPSLTTMEKWAEDGKCKATDGCWVEPDGVCPHGCQSWMLKLGFNREEEQK